MGAGTIFHVNGAPPVDLDVYKAIDNFNKTRDNKTLLQKFIARKSYDQVIANLDATWETAFNKLNFHQKTYIKKLKQLNNNPLLIDFENANIRLSTIHHSKGSEADYVVVLNGMVKATYDTYIKDRDSELRVLFVAITRARKGLFIINDPKFRHKYEELL